MANKSLFSRIFSKDNSDSEIKALQDRLDIVSGEQFDASSYETKFIEAESSLSGSSGMTNFAGSDQIVDITALQKVYATETWVYASVNAISDTVASLPLRLEKRREYKRTVFNDMLGDLEQVTNEAWEPANGAALNRLFQCPNPHSTRAEFISLILIDLLTAGDYYIYLDSDQDLSALALVNEQKPDPGKDDPWARLRTSLAANTHIKHMYRIPPSMIKPVIDRQDGALAGYELQTDRGSCVFDKSEIIHVRLPNPNDPMFGLSPMIPVFKSILLDRFTTEHMIRFYKSGARLGGIIQTDKALNKEQLGRFQRSFESNFTGRHNHHRTLILPPGMDYKLVEQNPAETALLEFCRYNREAILSAYRVPPIKLGIMENANYANARVQLKMFFTQTVKKYLEFIQEGFNTHPAMILDSRTYRVQFDLSNVEELQEDLKEKAMAASEMLKAGATVNEVREAVWKKGPIKGGEDSPVIVGMKAQANGGFPPRAEASAEQDDKKELEPTKEAAALSLSGTQVEAMMNIVQQVSKGELPKLAGVEIVISSFGVQREAAERMMGSNDSLSLGEAGKSEAKEALPNAQADTACLSDITPTIGTFSERVSQLVAAFVAGGVPISIAVPKAIEQAKQEGFTDPEDDGPDNDGGTKPEGEEGQEPKNEDGKDLGTQGGDVGAEFVPTNIGGKPKKEPCQTCGKLDCACDGKGGNKPTFAEFVESEIAKLGDEAEVTSDLMQSLKAKYDALGEVKEVHYANGFTKEALTHHWKTFISKTDPIIVKRHVEVVKYFDKYKSIVMNRLGANLKSFGLHKARDSDDVNEITDPAAYTKLINEYIAQIDKSLNEAMEAGYADTLTEFKFGPPTEEAKAALRAYALRSAKFIDETTREQMKSLLVKMFEDGKSVQEIGIAIRDKFDEISSGRAQTIARTETMTAVSLGKAAKRTEWQQRFPDQKLLKMWITAKDDRVRDSHEALEGVSVPAGETFPNGLAYPRDPSGDAEDVINCRCDILEYVDEDKEVIESILAPDDEEKGFNPDQARDENGRFAGGGTDNTPVRVGDKPTRISEGGAVSTPKVVTEEEPRSINDIRSDHETAKDSLLEAEVALAKDPDNQAARNRVGLARSRLRAVEREIRANIERLERKPKKQ